MMKIATNDSSSNDVVLAVDHDELTMNDDVDNFIIISERHMNDSTMPPPPPQAPNHSRDVHNNEEHLQLQPTIPTTITNSITTMPPPPPSIPTVITSSSENSTTSVVIPSTTTTFTRKAKTPIIATKSAAEIAMGPKYAQPQQRNKVRSLGLADWTRLLSVTKDIAQLQGRPIRRDITLTEVRQHNKMHDAWIILQPNNRVYNISPYLPYHPGGITIMKLVVGKDATTLFQKYHPWVNIDGLIGKLLIGYLDTTNSTITRTVSNQCNSDDDDDDDDNDDV